MASASPLPEIPLPKATEPADIAPCLDPPPALDNQSEQQSKDPFVAKWQVFGSTFLTIFFAEMGDKTQIATLLMTAESHAPWVIFLGASTALFTTSLMGVLLGRWLANRLSPQTLDRSAAIMLLGVAAMLFWEVSQG